MPMVYDTEIYNKFRNVAITDVDQLIVGETYYSNCYPDRFVLTRLLTNREAYRKLGLSWEGASADDIAWFETEDGQHYSLHDHNVTQYPYNPWMLFKTKEERDECNLYLKIIFDYDYDDYDDYRSY